ncbi:hypothetical protein AB6A23_07285 [Paenibacillus tarimensis]
MQAARLCQPVAESTGDSGVTVIMVIFTESLFSIPVIGNDIGDLFFN